MYDRKRTVIKNVPPKGKRKTIGGKKKDRKWLVSVNYPYYPTVEEFTTYEEALEEYKNKVEYAEDENVFTNNVYLSEVSTEYKNKITGDH